MPDLSFKIEEAAVVPFAIAPTLAFKLRIDNADAAQTIHTVALRCQIQIEVTRRRYTPEEQASMRDLFGEPERWSQTLRSLLVDPRQRRRAQLSGRHTDRSSRSLHIRFQRGCDKVFRRSHRRGDTASLYVQRHRLLCRCGGCACRWRQSHGSRKRDTNCPSKCGAR